ncbi:MAG: SHOCT domain-containing protein [Acidimicrobiales bacterium]
MPLRRRPVARLATTAVVAGTAAHMGAKSAERSGAATQAPAAPPEATPEAASPEDAQIEQIQKLATLKDQGILTEEEFTAKKAQILGI